jgi:hypothetical protein
VDEVQKADRQDEALDERQEYEQLEPEYLEQ